ncbi:MULTISPECIES: MDR family MFS transporter [Alteribacter]|uniref:MFS transporter n=1 Tax=Alteribacter keqinensis TaxID=2483800 RepID=A0A3M7TTL2_9BACI|nr:MULTISPECIES: MDR family MFS transporter [Alteribacter]MBM7097176.1 MFS transporter [Alteribacter salitolerans]RNA68783.1 MFS transporter [Alteribacter keqinensis]
MGSSKRRPLILACVMLAMFMSAVEATIVSTAMPSIVADLGGFSLFSWIFSTYLLMQVVTIPIYGKLSDMFGRKIVFATGVSFFLIGSVMCGFAPSIEWLIASRVIQGIGAGAVQPIATTIVGDIYTKEERAKIQGYLASVWGISAVMGPVLGGLILQFAHWQWVFWINIPIGIISVTGIIFFLKEKVKKEKKQIDYAGTGYLLVGITALMLVFIQSGTAWAWASPQTGGLLGVFVFSLLMFIRQEKRAKDPVMTLSIWNDRLIATANVASLTLGAVLIGVSSYLPTYVQIVLGESAMTAGFTLTMMSVGWPISSTLAGRLLVPLGSRKTAMLGACSLLIGATMFLLLSYVQQPLWAGAASFFIGGGMGFTTTTFIVSIQSQVDWNVRGTATASNMFMRILGSALGVAMLGGLLNNRLAGYLKEEGAGIDLPQTLDAANLLLDPVERRRFSEEELNVLSDGIAFALNSVYLGVFIMALISIGLIVSLPKKDKGSN